MRYLSVDTVLVATALFLHAILVAVFFRKRLARSFPIFVIYLLFNLVEDPLAWFLASSPAYSDAYTRFYFAGTVLDYVLQILIVAEIAWNVLRPSRRSLPFPIAPVATVAILICAIVAASFSPRIQSVGVQHITAISLQLTLALALLKLLLFAALAGFSQLLGIGWKNRVFQLATGLAFYGVASLFVQLTIRHLQTTNYPSYVSHFVELTQIQTGAYIGTLIFWIWAFSRNEAPRKDFTPQMQEVLVTIAQSAKRTRLAVTRSTDRR